MLYYGNYERQDEINNRIQELQKSSRFIEPHLSPVPLPTRCTTALPILVKRAVQPEIPLVHHADFDMEKDFASYDAPISGFNVNDESRLHNQYFAHQRGGIRGVYIPSSRSDLYRVPVVYKPSSQPFMGLFERPQLSGRQLPPELQGVGNKQLFNHTRQQLRDDGDDRR